MRAVLVCVVLALAAVPGVRADDDHEQAWRLREEGRVVPLAQILESARSQYSGRLLEAELKHKGGRYYYKLEIVDDKGIVWELEYDAVKGDLLNAREDD